MPALAQSFRLEPELHSLTHPLLLCVLHMNTMPCSDVKQVTKHAGSVQKGFALIGGILVTAVVQSTLEDSALTLVRKKRALEEKAGGKKADREKEASRGT